MPRYELSDVGHPGDGLTEDQRLSILNEWNETEARRPEMEWRQAMQDADAIVPRYIEDLYDAMDPATQARVSQTLRDNIAAKKALRNARP